MRHHFASKSRAALAAALVALCSPSVGLGRSEAASAARQSNPAALRRPTTPTRLNDASRLDGRPSGPVVLYGDSLAWEAQDQFRQTLLEAGIADIRAETYGGTAICDWLNMMRRDEATMHPSAVVVEFSGNALTPCMRTSAGASLSGQPYFAKYAQDAESALDIFAAARSRVYLAGAPIGRQMAADRDADAERLNAIYRALAGSHANIEFVDAGEAVLDNGHWTATLPCLADEPCNGRRDAAGRLINIVRAPDGTHFCPSGHPATQGVTGTCSEWSSGAFRYGHALAAPVAMELGSGVGPPTRARD